MSAAPVLNAMKRVSFEVANGPLKGEIFHFAKPVITIGRGSENDLVLSQDLKVSRVHVEIRQSGGLVTVLNRTDKNSLLLNGQLIKSQYVEGSVRLMVGDTELFMHVMASPKPAGPPTIGGAGSPASVNGARPPSPRVAPPPPPRAGTNFATADGQPKLLIFGLLGIAIVIGVFLFSGKVRSNKKAQAIKTNEEIQSNIKVAKETSEDIKKQFEQTGVDTRSYQTAQQQYVKGFRDFNQGQYSRAIKELGAAVTYYPQHELARRYLNLAVKKQDELVKAQFELGQKYRGQSSFRGCVGAMKKVITLVDDPEDKISKEAEAILQECELKMAEKY